MSASTEVSSKDLPKDLQAPHAALASTLKKLRALQGETPPAALSNSPTALDPSEPTLGVFLRSFMLWDATQSKAEAALRKLEQALVDSNEMRVCLPDELVAIIGERYPRAAERALRLRSALSGIYAREHAITLETISTLGKRQAMDYLTSLEGVPEFVAARVVLLSIGAHAAPVDSRLLHRLVEAKIVDKSCSICEAGDRLEQLVPHGEMPEVYTRLQAWSDDQDLVISGAEPPRVSLKPAAKPDAALVGPGRKPAARTQTLKRTAAGRTGGKGTSTRGTPPGKRPGKSEK